jgi:hypothetical protein
MRNHRLATLVVAAAMTTASGLAVAPSAHAGNAIVELRSAYSFACLQPAGGSSGLGVAIIQEPCNDTLAQQWTVTSASSGVHLVNGSSGLCMDARGGAVSGTPVEQWTCDWISNDNSGFGQLVSAYPDPGTGEELVSGVSGTYSHCVSTGMLNGDAMNLQDCTNQPWELWNRPSV